MKALPVSTNPNFKSSVSQSSSATLPLYSWKGLVPFSEGLKIQERAFLRARREGLGTVLGMEHPLVVTGGVRTSEAEKAQFQEAFPQVPIVSVPRGGQLTFHNPGQLVIYPILPLPMQGRGVKVFLEALMKATEEFLAELGVSVMTKPCPGLYTEKGKIASFGLHVREGIAAHGLSINIRNDLELFPGQSLCGEARPLLTSISAEQGLEKVSQPMSQYFLKWVEIFYTSYIKKLQT